MVLSRRRRRAIARHALNVRWNKTRFLKEVAEDEIAEANNQGRCSCIPGADYDGYTQSEGKDFYTTEELMARMACCYAGFVSEKMFFTHSYVQQRGQIEAVQDVKNEALGMAEAVLRYRKRTLERLRIDTNGIKQFSQLESGDNAPFIWCMRAVALNGAEPIRDDDQ
uniref:Phage portal protein n=1 Tax=Globodera pallida TaxID=36090 RepID=A0A183CIU3_GLOPA